MTWVIAVDIGGTFTDVVALSTDGRLISRKVLTTPGSLELGVQKGLQGVRGTRGGPRTGRLLVHGTTLVSNAIVERNGAKTALVCTRGFRDILSTGTEGRYSFFDAFAPTPLPLVPRRLRFELSERTLVGGMETPIDRREAVDLAEHLKTLGAESVAIAFINSYVDRNNEVAVAELFADAGIRFVSVSSAISRRMREYPRTSTAVADAYVKPRICEYLDKLDGWLDENGFTESRYMMQSEGGLTNFREARAFPIKLVESGPVGAVVLAGSVSRNLELESILAFDMGGTTAKLCVVADHRLPIADEIEVARESRFERGSGLPLSIPSVDLIEVGAGGGSIVTVAGTGLIEVGPLSAGASPGPACYGRGGDAATVTDADLVLGYLPSALVGGDFVLSSEAALAALDRLPVKLGANQSGIDVAHAIFEIVSHAMASAALQHGLDRGVDITQGPLVATGGAGPVHAWRVAELASISRIVIPPEPGVASALGMATSPATATVVRSVPMVLSEVDAAAVQELIDQLRAEAIEKCAATTQGSTPPMAHTYVSVRYRGQWHEIEVELPQGLVDTSWLSELRRRFDDSFGRMLQRASLDYDLELLDWRCTAVSAGERPPLPLTAQGSASTSSEDARHREARFADEMFVVPVVTRASIPPKGLVGPVFVDEPTTTTVVPPGWSVRVSLNCLLLWNGEGSEWR